MTLVLIGKGMIRPCFGGLTFKKRGHWGTRDIHIKKLILTFQKIFVARVGNVYIVFLSEQTGRTIRKTKGMPCPGLLILLSFFSSGEMVMPKWCKWSFLLELLYLEQPSAAVAYSHFSPRW